MNASTLLAGLFIASGFALWPVIAKFSKAPDGWVGVVVMAVTAIIVAWAFGKDLASSAEAMNMRAWALLVVAGIANGIAVWLYTVKVADVNVPTGLFIVLVGILMSVMGPILSLILNGEGMSMRQIVGILAGCGAIYLIGTG